LYLDPPGPDLYIRGIADPNRLKNNARKSAALLFNNNNKFTYQKRLGGKTWDIAEAGFFLVLDPLKGLSYKIDFKNFNKNLQNLA
jgi:hypothetical protein